MYDVWQVTRTEATQGISEAELIVITDVLTRLKSNLVEACGRAPLTVGDEA
jgi:hypothetical protein